MFPSDPRLSNTTTDYQQHKRLHWNLGHLLLPPFFKRVKEELMMIIAIIPGSEEEWYMGGKSLVRTTTDTDTSNFWKNVGLNFSCDHKTRKQSLIVYLWCLKSYNLKTQTHLTTSSAISISKRFIFLARHKDKDAKLMLSSLLGHTWVFTSFTSFNIHQQWQLAGLA